MIEFDVDGRIICPYNRGCSCEVQECDKCGWNPEVAESRLKKFKEKLPMLTKLYRVPFTGYCEVWATSPEEAADKAEDIQQQFFADYDYGEPICLEEEEEDELD